MALASLESRGLNQLILESVMIALVMIVGDELGDGASEVTLAERNHPVLTLLF